MTDDANLDKPVEDTGEGKRDGKARKVDISHGREVWKTRWKWGPLSSGWDVTAHPRAERLGRDAVVVMGLWLTALQLQGRLLAQSLADALCIPSQLWAMASLPMGCSQQMTGRHGDTKAACSWEACAPQGWLRLRDSPVVLLHFSGTGQELKMLPLSLLCLL